MKNHIFRKTLSLGAALVMTLSLAALSAGAAQDEKREKAAIVDGMHQYMPRKYVEPSEPAVREKLEWFKDQKLGIMMHWGIYSQTGDVESWGLSDADKEWSRARVDWAGDGESYKRQYWGLNRSFNPVRFRPEVWADLAAKNGFRYLIFTARG